MSRFIWKGALPGASPLPFCLESAPVDWELEIGPMRKMPQLRESALPETALGANIVKVSGAHCRELRWICDFAGGTLRATVKPKTGDLKTQT